MIVVVQIIRPRVVRDVEIRPAVVVVIAPDCAQAVIFVGVVDASFLRDFLERAVATVVVKQIRFANHAPGATLHHDASKLAGAEGGRIREVNVHITRHKNVHEAVFVVIRPGCAGHEAASPYAGRVSNVFELAIAAIAVQRVSSVSGDKNVRQTIVVKIRDRDAHAPALPRETCLLRNVREFQWRGLPIERDHRIAARVVPIQRRAVDHQRRKRAAVVAIDETDSAAHRFDNEFLVGRRDVGHRESGAGADVFKCRNGGSLLGILGPTRRATQDNQRYGN